MAKVSSEDPAELFELIERLGEGSYGEVYSALDRRTDKVVGIKVIPVEADATELMKEIQILEDCDSPYVVGYLGSYMKDGDLWIVMEYCAAGSLTDLMTIANVTLGEKELQHAIAGTLLGLEYLHSTRLIHRDMKAGNVLLTADGMAKLADFGVSTKLQSTLSKRNSVIGTPFWMAPEVIQQSDYVENADIWSLGITAIELADGEPPFANIHPMRAIFLIPTKDPPTVRDPTKWSPQFIDFLAAALQKDPASRPSAKTLLEHPFVKDAAAEIRAADGVSSVLKALAQQHLPAIEQARREEMEYYEDEEGAEAVGHDDAVSKAADAAARGTLRGGTLGYKNGTMIKHGTLVKASALVSAAGSQPSYLADIAADAGRAATPAARAATPAEAAPAPAPAAAAAAAGSAPSSSDDVLDLSPFNFNAAELGKLSVPELTDRMKDVDKVFRTRMQQLSAKYDAVKKAISAAKREQM